MELINDMGYVMISHLREMAISQNIKVTEWSTIESWLGCIGREMNEQDRNKVNRAWNSYLADGIAPSIRLQKTFDSYRKQSREENWDIITLPEQIKDTFDRILATEQEIEESLRARNINQINNNIDTKNQTQVDVLNSNTSNKTKKYTNKNTKLNIKKGLFRIFMLITIIWIVTVLYMERENVKYCLKYIFKYDAIKKSNVERIHNDIDKLDYVVKVVDCNEEAMFIFPFAKLSMLVDSGVYFDIEGYTKSYCGDYNKNLKDNWFKNDMEKVRKDRKNKILAKINTLKKSREKALANVIVNEPNYIWVFKAFICPLLLVPLAFIAYWLSVILGKTVRWVCEGFR